MPAGGVKRLTNRLRQLLTEDRPLLGTFLNFPSAAMVEFSGLAGFDWVLIDGEHEGTGVETCYELVRAANAVGVGSVVRIPASRPEIVLGYAETGVDAILCPHIDSRAAVQAFVKSVRYWPAGARGAASNSRAASYGFGRRAAEYFQASDEHALTAGLLEDAVAFERLHEIAGEPGLDLVAIGPGDLAMSMGLPGQASHPQVSAALRAAVPVLREHGKHVILPAADAAAARAAVELGARLVVASNAALLGRAIQDYLAAVAR